MPNTYTELLKTTVGTATPTVTFDLTGISGYTDLVLVANYTNAGTANSTKFWVNGDTGSNYSVTGMGGDGSAARSWRASNQAFIKPDDTNGASSTIATAIYNFQNYSNSTTYKTIIGRTNNTQYGLDAFVGLWRNTNAITSISLAIINGANWAVGSTFSLYGIANADQGAAKATGGVITEDATYWYHTFGASSAFIPKQSLTCDVLVVAGGGGGGCDIGGGGGAGGVLAFASQSLTATSYNVTVGAGGAGATSSGRGTVGVDSQFAALTLVKGGGGGGGNLASSGGAGGSGGGGGYSSGAAGTATSGQGSDGGASPSIYAAGGGGKGSVGIAGTSSGGGAGGAGTDTVTNWGSLQSVLTTTSIGVSGYIAGGGGAGGHWNNGNPGGAAGSGGAGIGATAAGTFASTGGNGVIYTGSGAGGGSSYSGQGGRGGSGVIIVRYAK
jgi:hypothetical protein